MYISRRSLGITELFSHSVSYHKFSQSYIFHHGQSSTIEATPRLLAVGHGLRRCEDRRRDRQRRDYNFVCCDTITLYTQTGRPKPSRRRVGGAKREREGGSESESERRRDRVHACACYHRPPKSPTTANVRRPRPTVADMQHRQPRQAIRKHPPQRRPPGGEETTGAPTFYALGEKQTSRQRDHQQPHGGG
jgi:hypothetical protein